jgi:hypothetical protein
MQSIRRTVLVFTATLIAIVAGSGTAFAFPPEIQPEPTTAPNSGGSSSGGFFDSWPQVTLAILVVAAVLVIAAVGVSLVRHHTPARGQHTPSHA